MGDESKKPKMEDHTVEVSTDDLRVLRESAQHMTTPRAALAAREPTRPQLRPLSARAPHALSGDKPAPDLREVLKPSSRLADSRDEGGATKSIKRDNLVELLKGELKEANAEEAPNSGILRHTRAKGDTPQGLPALGRGQDDPAMDRSRAGQKTSTDLEELARALDKSVDEDPNEATRQISVINELRAPRASLHTPARPDHALAALSSSSRGADGDAHEATAMPALLRGADAAAVLGLSPHSAGSAADEPSDYSLEEFEPQTDSAGAALDGGAAASPGLRAGTAPAEDIAASPPMSASQARAAEGGPAPIIAEVSQTPPTALAPPEPTAAPVVTSAVMPEVQRWLDVPTEAKMSEAETAQGERGDGAKPGERPMLGRVLVFGAGASVAVMGLGLAFSDVLDEAMWGLIIAGVGMLVMGLALLFLRSAD